jgi:hypothetical protein
LAAMVTAAAVIGSLIGERMTSKIDPRVLRTVFGVLVLLMASGVIVRATGHTFGPAVAVIVVAMVGLYLFVRRPGADGRIDSLAAPVTGSQFGLTRMKSLSCAPDHGATGTGRRRI